MLKKMKLFGKVCLSVFVLLSCLNVSSSYLYAEGVNTLNVDSHGIDGEETKPETLGEGQVWTNKSLVDNGDGSFKITLRAIANSYASANTQQSALAQDTNLVITDVIGDGFALNGDLPQSLSINGNTIVWSISANEISANANDVSVSFNVKYNSLTAGTYYTNESANAVFTPNANNPYYYTIEQTPVAVQNNVEAQREELSNVKDTDIQQVSDEVKSETAPMVAEIKATPKNEFVWNQSSIINELTTKGYINLVKNEAVNDTPTVEEKKEETVNTIGDTSSYSFLDAGPLLRQGTSTRSIMEAAQNDAVETSKKATLNSDGSVEINLEAYVTGNVVTHTEPVDVVLVLDQSGSMRQSISGKAFTYLDSEALDFLQSVLYVEINSSYQKLYYNAKSSEWYYKKGTKNITVTQKINGNNDGYDFYIGNNQNITKREALQQAANNFISSMVSDATEGDINHRIAVVGFGEGQAKNYSGTELLSLSEGKKNYASLTATDYANAFQDANTIEGKDILSSSIKNITSENYVLTNTNYGIEMANNILKNASSTDRAKAIIVFTDGEPNDVENSDNFINYSIANKALVSSSEMKANNATVYTVGIIEGANPTASLLDKPNTLDAQVNKFMHLLSSNYLDSGSANMDRTVESDAKNPQNNGYYLTAKTSSDLSEIFNNIYEQISPSINLDGSTVLSDTISDYFELTDDSVIEVTKSEYKGKDSSGNMIWGSETEAQGVSTTINGNKIDVTGFDYSANPVVTKSDNSGSGYKIKVKIKNVKQIDGFIGGDNIPTNKTNSGIYDKNGNIVENFEMPTVNVPLNFDFNTNDTSIYVGSTWDNVMEFLQNENGDLYYIKDGVKYTFGNKRNDYVDVVYTIKYNNKVVGTYRVSNKGNTLSTIDKFNVDTTKLLNDVEKYTIEANVVSIYNKNNTLNTNNKTSNMAIFKPSINVSDSIVFLKESSKIRDCISNEIKWESKGMSNAPKPSGNEPTLNIGAKEVKTDGIQITEFDEEFILKESTQYKLSVYNGEVDLTNIVSITNTTKNNDKDKTHDLTIYVLKGQIDLTKKIDTQYTNEDTIHANQSFVFKIEQYNEQKELVKTFYQTINFSANDGKTKNTVSITGLEKGYYTISEVSDLSWKYQLAGSESNYDKNQYSTTEIYIGDKLDDTNAKLYFGVEKDSIINTVDYANEATASFSNSKKKDSKVTNMFGDVASAINQFNSTTSSR